MTSEDLMVRTAGSRRLHEPNIAKHEHGCVASDSRRHWRTKAASVTWRYWEHVIEDEADFEAHFDYIHYNPVKHGYVRCPREGGPSSFHRCVEKGVYPIDWACGGNPPPKIVDRDYGEPG